MPTDMIQHFAARTGQPEWKVEEKWQAAKNKVTKETGMSDDNPEYWGAVTNVLKDMLKIDQFKWESSGYPSNTVKTQVWADVPFEEGKPFIGHKEKDKNISKLKKYIERLLVGEDVATAAPAATTSTISVASDISGGAGNGVFANKVGTVKKRKKPMLVTFKDLISRENA
jgi:hypothetical protein